MLGNMGAWGLRQDLGIRVLKRGTDTCRRDLERIPVVSWWLLACGQARRGERRNWLHTAFQPWAVPVMRIKKWRRRSHGDCRTSECTVAGWCLFLRGLCPPCKKTWGKQRRGVGKLRFSSQQLSGKLPPVGITPQKYLRSDNWSNLKVPLDSSLLRYFIWGKSMELSNEKINFHGK